MKVTEPVYGEKDGLSCCHVVGILGVEHKMSTYKISIEI